MDKVFFCRFLKKKNYKNHKNQSLEKQKKKKIQFFSCTLFYCCVNPQRTEKKDFISFFGLYLKDLILFIEIYKK